MAKAVELYFDIKNGDFSKVSKGDRRKIAENIQVIADGDKSNPNIIIYDDGEGQHPDDFANTFLSLGKRNKSDIHFVQGKYNMGSTGAVAYCGQYRYQLIASKLNEKLFNNNKKKNEFGFTLVRRHPLTIEQEEIYRNSWYEYLIIDGKIPRFSINELDIGLHNRDFKYGSIIKLFSYELPRGSRSDISIDLWRDLNQYLYCPALPFMLYEKRFEQKRYDKGKDPTKLVLGNKTRIIIDDRDKKEKTLQISFTSEEIGTVDIELTALKPEVQQKEFIKDKPVIFTLNGQVHGFLPKSFISKDIGFQMLRDSLLIQIECSKIRTNFRMDLFMANRYNLKESEKLSILLDEIKSRIKSDEFLRDLNQERRNNIYRGNKPDKELLNKIIAAVPLDKDLLNLLKKTGELDFLLKHSEGNKENKKERDHNKNITKPKASKRFPSIFKIKLNEDVNGKRIKSIPLNGKGIINFETDVEDEYLFRPKDRGELQIQILGIDKNGKGGGGDIYKPGKVEETFNVTVSGPTNSAIKITFEPKKILNVGDVINICTILTSPDGDYESIFYIKIVDPQKTEEKPKEKSAEAPSLPRPIRVFKIKESDEDASWGNFGWNNGEEIIKIIPAPADEKNNEVVEAIAVNMDSYALTKFISQKRINSPKQIELVKKEYFTSTYLHGLFLYSILEKINQKSDNKWETEDLISSLFKGYSSFLLHSKTNDEILNSLEDD